MTEEEFWGHPHEPDFLAPRPQRHFGWRFFASAVGGGLASWVVVCTVAWALWRGLGL